MSELVASQNLETGLGGFPVVYPISMKADLCLVWL